MINPDFKYKKNDFNEGNVTRGLDFDLMGTLEAINQRLKNIEGGSSNFSDRNVFPKNIQMLDGRNIQTAVGTGTKIATSATQKIGFYGISPIAQPSSTGETTGQGGSGGSTTTNQSTFTGNNGSTAYTILDIVKHLKNLGLLLK